MIGQHMPAWEYARFGEPDDVLSMTHRAMPHPGAAQVVVRVSASAVNFADRLVIGGTYQFRPPLPAIAGLEVAGTVVDAGPGAEHLRGAEVAGMTAGMVGGFAEFAVMDVIDVGRVPRGYTAAEAAAFPVAYQTAWFALHRRGRLRPGDVVLVHAAAGGVGSAAVQLAKAHGALVAGVVGGVEKRTVAEALGCDLVVERGDPAAVEVIRDWSPTGAVDLVVDPVGAASHLISEKVIGFEGVIAVVGFASGDFPRLRAEHALVKNYSIVGVHWGLYRSRRPDLVHSERDRLVEAVEHHGIHPLVSEVFAFAQVPAALRAVASGTTVGRVIVEAPPRTNGKAEEDGS